VIVPVSDPDDPRLEPYRGVKERDLVGRQGRFIAEGRVVVEKLIRAGRHPVRSLLLAQKRVGPMESLLAALPDEVPVYAAGQAVMDAVVGFHIHRGVLALGDRVDLDVGALLAGLPARALVVALSAVANHDNMGGVFRNAAAFGADAVVLDADCCDPLYRKAIRVSVGAALTTPFAQAARGADLVELLRAADLEVVALSPGGTAELRDVASCPRIAALFGSEGPGLPDEVLARTRTVRIAMAAGFDSLNLATTSGIVLHALSRPPAQG
jgi:tRNA G18 (ribose-2'-O)-methylase SpoU